MVGVLFDMAVVYYAKDLNLFDDDKTESPSSFTTRSETSKTRNTSSGALKNGPSNRSNNTIGNVESADRNAKKQARAAAARAASSGRYLKPPPLSSTPTGTTSSASARVISDAQAKSRGRRPNNSSSVRYQPRRAIPSAFQSSPSAFQNPDGRGDSVVGTSNVTKLQRLQEEVAAKAFEKKGQVEELKTRGCEGISHLHFEP